MAAPTPSSCLADGESASRSVMFDGYIAGQILRLPQLTAITAGASAPDIRITDNPHGLCHDGTRVTGVAERLADARHIHVD
jgi:hypothetical protein